MKKVEDLEDNEGKQIILDGWKELVYQNTPDKFYISIPHCPDNLTPEELEMLNGGCIIAVFVFVIQSIFAAAGISSTNTPVGGNLGASATNRNSKVTIR